MIVVLKKI